ncbi:hypothetical protein QR77_07545 [Streptomyces sp. 150FB]|nr:hypothetical protein QR77_07545 [Streptomyces sp. 150FB]
MCAAEIGHDAQAGLPHRELHVRRDDPQVTGQRELESGADRMALDDGDRHDVAAAEPAEAVLVSGDGGVEFRVGAPREVEEGRFALEALGGERLPVEPGGEGLALAAHHHDPDAAGQ